MYAVDWNQARENVISGAAWLGGAGAVGGEVTEQLRKPTAMICSSRGAERTALAGGRKKRDETLLDMIRETVAKGGIVLIPTDSSARVIELAYLLEHAWVTAHSKSNNADELRSAKLYLAARSIGTTMRYARSMLEWMDESVVREFESRGGAESGQQQSKSNERQDGGRGGNDEKDGHNQSKSTGVFDFRYLQLIEKRKDMERVLRQSTKSADKGQRLGTVILASDTSLQWGFSKEVLKRIASDSCNLLVLTERFEEWTDIPPKGQLQPTQTIWSWFTGHDDSQLGGQLRISGAGREVEVLDARRAPLEGNELLIYQQYLATRHQLHTSIPSSSYVAADAVAESDDESSASESTASNESVSNQQGKALNTSMTVVHSGRNKLHLSNEELGINVLIRRNGIYDFTVRGKKGREKMFPFVARRRRNDEFGEVIRPEEYLKAEERDEADGQDLRTSDSSKTQPQAALGRKRRWEDTGLQEPSGARGPSKRALKQKPSGLGKSAGQANKRDSEDDVGRSDNEDDIEDSDTDEAQEATGPSKVITTTAKIQVNLDIAYVDFAGIHDKRSLQMLIPLIGPRKLVLIEGSKNETLSLATDCRRLLSGTGEVYTPTNGMTVDASVDTHAWAVKLSDGLVRRLQWQAVKGLGVVHIHGLLRAPDSSLLDGDEQKVSKKLKTSQAGKGTSDQIASLPSETQDDDNMPTLDVVPIDMAATTRAVTQSLHVGDLRLADLKRVLQGSGHSAEFIGEGTLLVDGFVAVRKTGIGMIEVEGDIGPLSGSDAETGWVEEDFESVRRKIYEGLAVVAGG